MVHLGAWRGGALTLSIKPNCLTISLQSAGESRVFSWDLAGRLWTAMLHGISYRRGLDGKIVAKWQTTAGRSRRTLTPNESREIEEQARLHAHQLAADVLTGRLMLSPPTGESVNQVLKQLAAFDAARYAADVSAYAAVYQPVGILPPDQYMAVVLQATLGCSFNTCTFCDFYRDRRFHIRTAGDFREHARAVRDFLGAGLSLRRTVFLGDANALVIPMPRLVQLLEITNQEYDIERLGGIYAFLDGFSGDKKTSVDFALLHRLGLKRVYIGLESGHDPLLRFLQKPGSAQDALQAVQAMKTGGVAVGIIVLLGASGSRFARPHIEDTIALLNRMELDADDILYFSELIESDEMQYTRDAFAQNLLPLTATQRLDQGEEIENRLVFDETRGVPHIARYDIREFVY